MLDSDIISALFCAFLILISCEGRALVYHFISKWYFVFLNDIFLYLLIPCSHGRNNYKLMRCCFVFSSDIVLYVEHYSSESFTIQDCFSMAPSVPCSCCGDGLLVYLVSRAWFLRATHASTSNGGLMSL